MDASEKRGAEFKGRQGSQGRDAELDSAGYRGARCPGPCRGMGLVHQPARERGVPGQTLLRPDSVSRRLRDCAYPRRAAALRPEEVGLLDRLASGQCLPACDAHLRGPCIHAARLRPVPCQRHLVARVLAQAL